MTKTTVKMVLAAAATFMLASNANAGPLVLSNAQLDSVAAAGAQRIEAETADCYAFLPRADPATGAFSRGRVCR